MTNVMAVAEAKKVVATSNLESVCMIYALNSHDYTIELFAICSQKCMSRLLLSVAVTHMKKHRMTIAIGTLAVKQSDNHE